MKAARNAAAQSVLLFQPAPRPCSIFKFLGSKKRSSARPQSVAESISSGVWDDKYIKEYGELKYATALLQGNRQDTFKHYI